MQDIQNERKEKLRVKLAFSSSPWDRQETQAARENISFIYTFLSQHGSAEGGIWGGTRTIPPAPVSHLWPHCLQVSALLGVIT